MPIRNVIVEYAATAELQTAALLQLRGMEPAALMTTAGGPSVMGTLASVAGLQLDVTFPVTPIPTGMAAEKQETFLAALAIDPVAPPDVSSFIARGTIDSAAMDVTMSELPPGVAGIYADPTVAPCITCGSTGAVGTERDVASRLAVSGLQRAGMDGSDVLLAIVDTGINLDFLRGHGKSPNFSSAQSWVPKRDGLPPLVPGAIEPGHGTMCAYDALIAAPNATLPDIAVLQSRRHGATVMDGLLSDALLGFAFLYRFPKEQPR